MQMFKNFSTTDLLQWFNDESSAVLGKLIYLKPLSPLASDIFLNDLNRAHQEIEKRKLITENYF